MRSASPSASTSSRAMPMRAAAPAWRIADGRRPARASCVGVAVAGDQLPGLLVEIGVEAGQHHGAVRQLRDGGEQLRRSPASSRSSRRRSPGRRCAASRSRFGLDQQVAPRRRLDRAALARASPASTRARSSEIERELPVVVELVRHQPVELVPRHLPRRHVVHQPREIVGERQRGGRRVRDQRRAARRRASPARRPSSAISCGEQQPPLEAAERRRHVERARSRRSRLRRRRSRPRRCRRAATMRGRIAARLEHVEESVARQPAGAPRRQIERRARRAPADRAGPESRRPACRRAARRSASAETAPRREW